MEIDQRQGMVAAGVGAAAEELQAAAYPDLAGRLTTLVQRLQRCTTCTVLSSTVQSATGRPASTPLTEHGAVLSLLLALHRSRPSVRRRQVTFQSPHEGLLPSMCASAPLSTAVFAEAPDPHALTAISDTAVLLPEECGYPTDALAGLQDVSALVACMDVRPAWAPAAPEGLPQPTGAAWLPMPQSLLQMRGDTRLTGRPPPLKLPLSLLAMDESPGAATTFQGLPTPPGHGAAFDAIVHVRQQSGGTGGGHTPLDSIFSSKLGAVEGGNAATSGRLWSLDEAELAREALQALRGVRSALLRLQGALTVPTALPRPAAAGLLAKMVQAAALRQQLDAFLEHHCSTTALEADISIAPSTSIAAGAGAPANGTALLPPREGASSSGGVDPAMLAFASAVGRLLRHHTAELSALEEACSTTWVRSVHVAGVPGQVLHGQGLSPLQALLLTGPVRLRLRSLAELCWCTPAAGNAPPRWLQAHPLPSGLALLEHLYAKASTADAADGDTLQHLFACALQPYLDQFRRWVFTTQPLGPGPAAGVQLAGATALPFNPASVEAAAKAGGGRRKALPTVPAPLPHFLERAQVAFQRAGCQLRLLHSVGTHASQTLVAELASIWEMEQACQHVVHSLAASSPGSAIDPASSATGPGASWLTLPSSCSSSTTAPGGAGQGELLLTADRLQAAVAAAQAADAARQAAVDAWLAALALERRAGEAAALEQAAGKAHTLQQER